MIQSRRQPPRKVRGIAHLEDLAKIPAYRVGNQRIVEPEVMDDPLLDSERHLAALHGLARMNALSASARILWRPLQRLIREQPTRSLRVLDIATGSGDVPLQLWRRAKHSGVDLEVTCLDRSGRALDVARQRAAEVGAHFAFCQLDVRHAELPGEFDVVTTSLFLHHLDDEEAVRLLRKMKTAARRRVLVHDLVRSTYGLWLAYLATRLFSRSDVVHVDALRSVRAAFTIDEARCLAMNAGLINATIERRWPCRYLLSWDSASPH